MAALTPPQLAQVDLLAGLSPTELQKLGEVVRVRVFEAEQPIIAFQDATRDVFMLLAGRVRVTNYSHNGHEIAFRDLSAGQSFGEMAAIDGNPRSANVIALTRATVGSLTLKDFQDALRRYPSMAEATLRKLAMLVRALSERVAEFSSPAEARIAAEFQRQAQRTNPFSRQAILKPRPTNAYIANLVTTQREQVSRTITKLVAAGLMIRRVGELEITDIQRLAEWAQAQDEGQ